MKQRIFKIITRYTRWSFLSALAGILSGLAATLFLILLQWATTTRNQHQGLIWFLPLAGLAIGLIYHHYGKDVAGGHNLILDEIHDPKNKVPLRMAPLILLGTIATHLFGGSAGREGTAVQMGASLADHLTSFFRIEADERKILLVAGAGAGFGAAIGAPWAGAIFGMEVIYIGRLRLFAWFECLVASFVGYGVTLLLHAPHTLYPQMKNISYDVRTLLIVLFFGCLCGIAAFTFTSFTHIIEKFLKRWVSYPPLKPFLAGILLVLLYHLEGSYHYAGLGIPVIQNSLSQPSDLHVPLLKGFFTALTVASGFKGGEFIPLVFIGATMGSALSVLFKVSTQLLAALGFSAVFAGASNTPIACAVMTMEIFGPEIGGYALLACLGSYYFSGHKGIYKSQPIHMRKHAKLLFMLSWLGELPRRFLNGRNH